MNQYLFFITILALTTPQRLGFAHPRTFRASPRFHSEIRMAVELKEEPAGGDEMKQIDSMENCRMKNMGISNDDKVKSDDGSVVYSFWMTAEAEGSYVKQIQTKLLKEAGQKANFPGFRKVSIYWY